MVLRRGLGSNKLSLCMLVLSRLRETYWSAGVISRLFERAQALLGSTNAGVSKNTENSTSSSYRDGFHTCNPPVAGNEYREQRHQQEEEEPRDLMRPLSEPTLLMSEQPGPPWFNDPPCFSTVDQLLSPGFSISENAFQSLFTGYDNGTGGVYDQIIPDSNDVPIHLLYSS